MNLLLHFQLLKSFAQKTARKYTNTITVYISVQNLFSVQHNRKRIESILEWNTVGNTHAGFDEPNKCK